MIAELSLEEHVELTGPLPRETLLELFPRASVVAAPCVVGSDGNRDGLPTVLIEAMALRIPVVATPVTGIPELVEDGRTGLLVPERDPKALADAIGRLLRERETAQPTRRRRARARRARLRPALATSPSCARSSRRRSPPEDRLPLHRLRRARVREQGRVDPRPRADAGRSRSSATTWWSCAPASAASRRPASTFRCSSSGSTRRSASLVDLLRSDPRGRLARRARRAGRGHRELAAGARVHAGCAASRRRCSTSATRWTAPRGWRSPRTSASRTSSRSTRRSWTRRRRIAASRSRRPRARSRPGSSARPTTSSPCPPSSSAGSPGSACPATV